MHSILVMYVWRLIEVIKEETQSVLTLPSHHDYLLGQLVQHLLLVPLNDEQNTNKYINTLHLPSSIVRDNELVELAHNLTLTLP